MISAYHQTVKQLRAILEDELPNSRDRAMALTKLDELEMWVNRADAANVFEEVNVDRPTKLPPGIEEWVKQQTRPVVEDELHRSLLQEEAPVEAVRTPRTRAIEAIMEKLGSKRIEAELAVSAILESGLALWNSKEINQLTEQSVQGLAPHSEQTLVRAAAALMEFDGFTEAFAADIIRSLNNAGVYLRDA